MTARSLFDPPDNDPYEPPVVAAARQVTTPTPGAVGETDPATSWDAAVAITGRTGSQRRRVLDLFASLPLTGATNTEIETALGMDRPSGSNRRGELETAGLVQKVRDDNGKVQTRPTSTGQPATVYRITTLGAQVAEYLLTDDPVYRHAYLQGAT